MKYFSLILIFVQLSLAQSDFLWTEVSGDSVTFHHDETYRNCGALYTYDIQFGENQTLTITEIDTGDMVWCNCTFDLSVTLDGFSPGDWTAHIYALDQDQFGDTTYYGSVDFTIQPDWLIEASESNCGIVDDTTESLWLNTDGQNLVLDWALHTNCCIESSWETELVADTFYVTMIDTGAPCDCECSIMLTATFGPFQPGEYVLDLAGWPDQPTFIIEDTISALSEFQSACYWVNVNDVTLFPQSFKLESPFPNPFNPTTTVRFNIPVETQFIASLRIYDMTGRVVETLVDDMIEPGMHEIKWNVENHPSGVYFVKMISGDFTQTQKLVLMK